MTRRKKYINESSGGILPLGIEQRYNQVYRHRAIDSASFPVIRDRSLVPSAISLILSLVQRLFQPSEQDPLMYLDSLVVNRVVVVRSSPSQQMAEVHLQTDKERERLGISRANWSDAQYLSYSPPCSRMDSGANWRYKEWLTYLWPSRNLSLQQITFSCPTDRLKCFFTPDRRW